MRRVNMSSSSRGSSTATAVVEKPLPTVQPMRVIDDTNILQALDEDWDPDTTISPGSELEGASLVKLKGSPWPVLQRPARNLYEWIAFKFIRDARDIGELDAVLLASGIRADLMGTTMDGFRAWIWPWDTLHWAGIIDHLRFSVTLLPSALYMIFGKMYWWSPILHWVFLAQQLPTLTLALHVMSHLPLFKSNFLETFFPIVIGPLFGQTWGTYYLHHIKMHHIEDNGPKDLSSTLDYQRDDPLHFLHYFCRFYFAIWYELSAYLYRRKQYGRVAAMYLGEFGCIAMISYLAFYVNFWATFFTLVLPFNVERFLLMSGNWVEHAFLDPEDPLGGGFKNSSTIISTPFNLVAFNNAYHSLHHVHALRHYVDHPRDFLRRRDEIAKAGTVVLKDVNCLDVWFMLMRKRYDLLADKFVNVGSNRKEHLSKEQIVERLKAMTKAMSNEEVKALYRGKKVRGL
ncbi:hypothetical protein HDU97_010349 [Phlyctochytrium planicorne]|nr:hypothetical protein HDU97_010349 [Phlyctochytrium planicorne]